MTELRITSLADENRLDELKALNMLVHNLDDVFCQRVFELNPASRSPACHRFLVKDGRIVSGISLLTHTVRWHGTTIEAGEIGLVGTLEELRGKGYASMLMNDWLDTMREDKIPLAFLWGIPDFYQRFHFHYAYPNHGTPYVSLPRSCTVDWEPSGPIRRAQPEDRRSLPALYRAYNSDLTGCQVRSDEQWEYYFRLTEGEGNHGWWATEEPMGGYAFVAGDPPAVWEIAVSSLSPLRDLVIGLLEAHQKIEALDLYHHPRMPVGEWLYRWGARVSSPEDIWKGAWGGMVRLMDPARLLKLMAGRLSERLADSRLFDFTGSIPFTSEVGGAVIEIGDGAVEVHEIEERAPLFIPARVLSPIMMGYKGFERFREEMRDMPDRVAEVMSVLFQRDKVFMYSMLYADELIPRVT